MSDPTFETPPEAPNRSDPTNFSTRADAFASWMVRFRDEMATAVTWLSAQVSTIAGYVTAAAASATAAASSESAAAASASSASTSASQAAVAAGATAFTSPSSWTEGQTAYSPVTQKVYRALSDLTDTTTDPSADSTNWRDIALETLEVGAETVSITGTAVAYAIWDTAPWRDRGHGTSWHEDLGDIPVQVLVIAEADKVTLRDNIAPGRPEWMVFDAGAGNAVFENGNDITCIAVAGAQLLVGSNGYGGLSVIDFLADLCWTVTDSTTESYNVVAVSERNRGGATTIHAARRGAGLGWRDVRGCAAFAGPNAPIDPATGIPAPTWAIAHTSGLTLVHPDGTACQSTTAQSIGLCGFDEGGWLWFARDAAPHTLWQAAPADYASTGFGTSVAETTAGSDDFDLLTRANHASFADGVVALAGDGGATGGAVDGLMLHRPDFVTPASGLSALITDNFSTGWITAACELALSDGLTDRSTTGTAVTDNGAASIAPSVTGADIVAITASGGTITAPVTTGGVIYGWELVSGAWLYRAGTGWVGVSEAGGVLTIADGTSVALLRYASGTLSARLHVQAEADEAPLVKEGASAVLRAAAITALSSDAARGSLLAGHASGVDEVNGLRVSARNDTAVTTALAARNGALIQQ